MADGERLPQQVPPICPALAALPYLIHCTHIDSWGSSLASKSELDTFHWMSFLTTIYCHRLICYYILLTVCPATLYCPILPLYTDHPATKHCSLAALMLYSAHWLLHNILLTDCPATTTAHWLPYKYILLIQSNSPALKYWSSGCIVQVTSFYVKGLPALLRTMAIHYNCKTIAKEGSTDLAHYQNRLLF